MLEESPPVPDSIITPSLAGGDGEKPSVTQSKAGTSPQAMVTNYRASIYTAPNSILPREFVESVRALEKSLKVPVWFIIQNDHESPWGHLDEKVTEAFFRARNELKQAGPVALVIDSPGGYTYHAYKIAKILRNHCGGFTAVIPSYAKSAATILALGGDSILMTKDAELGPLDAQYYDPDREDLCSALDEVQALERLHAAALEAIDQTVLFMRIRSGKKVDALLLHATSFVSDMMRPMLDKIDTVHYSQMQRLLKEAEDYAARLLQPRYPEAKARKIARHLVEKYSEHGFLIDAAEAVKFGLDITLPTDEQDSILDAMVPCLEELTAIGRLEEVTSQ